MGMQFVRYGIPALLFVTGCVLAAVDSDRQRGLEVGGLVVGAAFTVLLMNVFFRIGVEGDKDRDKEEAARRFFDEHGYWPDERPRRG
jgi:Na+/melibiose symporter-like transporter